MPSKIWKIILELVLTKCAQITHLLALKLPFDFAYIYVGSTWALFKNLKKVICTKFFRGSYNNCPNFRLVFKVSAVFCSFMCIKCGQSLMFSKKKFKTFCGFYTLTLYCIGYVRQWDLLDWLRQKNSKKISLYIYLKSLRAQDSKSVF